MSRYNNRYNPLEKNTSWSCAEKFIKNNTTILEVGAGNGNFAEAMSIHRHCTVDAVEPNKSDAEQIKNIHKVINDSLENALPALPSSHYDTIVFLDVIEHLVNPVKVLQDVKRVLKKKGTVVFSVPNMAHSSVRLMLLSGRFEYGGTGLLDQTHLHFYTKAELTRIFAEAGYVIKKLKGVTEGVEEAIVYSELEKLGIGEPRDVMKAMRANEGDIYQFVGIAIPGNPISGELPKTSPNLYEMRDNYYKNENNRLLQIISELEK